MPPKQVLRHFFTLSLGWWKAGERAWLLSLALTTFLIINVGINFMVNRWNKHFFDALEQKDITSVWNATFVFLILVLLAAAIGVGIVLSRETLQVRWREWLIHRLMDKWILTRGFHTLQSENKEPSNPEYRIADDTRMAVEPIVDFAIGFVSSIVSAATFVSVLWMVGGSYTLYGVTIPAYMVFAAVIYAVIVSGFMVLIGHKLPSEVAKRNEAEAAFRFELTRVRENAAQITDSAEKRDALGETYSQVAKHWLIVVRRNGFLTWITNSNGVFVPVFPILLAAPKYLTGEFSLGEVTMLAGAFFQTQIAVAWLVDNFRPVAQCYASILRVTELSLALEGE
jgi:vitamin B12/bleomycin/antimicrobial peptide transport system ATP-binding/permease protein